MPSVILYCQHDGCGKGLASTGGPLPPVCPSCNRPAKWHTSPRSANKPLAFTRDDRRFLRSLRIDPESSEP